MKKHVLCNVGGQWRSLWQYGLGSCPLGFTTYSTNSIERSHRMLKGMMDPARRHMDLGEMILSFCQTVPTGLEQGYYEGLANQIDSPWPKLLRRKKPQWVDVNEGAAEETPAPRARRLDRSSLLSHWRQCGPRGTYVATACNKALADGSRARLLFVIPKILDSNSNIFCTKPVLMLVGLVMFDSQN